MACSRMKIVVALLFGRSDEYRETEHRTLTKGTDIPICSAT